MCLLTAQYPVSERSPAGLRPSIPSCDGCALLSLHLWQIRGSDNRRTCPDIASRTMLIEMRGTRPVTE